MDEIRNFPLTWPLGWKRTPANQRADGRFRTKKGKGYFSGNISINDACNRINDSLAKIGVRECYISTNIRAKKDGTPYANEKAPEDPGVAIYWTRGKVNQCIAVDRYTQVAQNLAAAAATLEALRDIERHGGAAIMDRAFSGFQALPEKSALRTWTEVLGLTHGCTEADIQSRFRSLVQAAHPDHGGSAEKLAELTEARKQALEAISS